MDCSENTSVIVIIVTVINYVREHILQFRRGLQKNPCPCLPLIFAAAENKYNYIIMGDKSSFLSNRKRKNVEWMETLHC